MGSTIKNIFSKAINFCLVRINKCACLIIVSPQKNKNEFLSHAKPQSRKVVGIKYFLALLIIHISLLVFDGIRVKYENASLFSL